METQLDFSLPAIPLSVRQSREAVGEVVARLGLSPPVIDDVRLCVSEAVANVVRHAYGRNVGDLGITVERGDSEVTIAVRDDGIGLSQFQREGDLGYGLRIIEQLTQRCAITSAPGVGTEVRMVFGLR
jgi:anti-sigma regulatory factor (Ser/Thr protein kinase)